MGRRLDFSALELDALRESGSLGAGRAATALSGLLGRSVGISVPKARVLRLEELPGLVGGAEALAAAVYFTVEGQAPGRLLLLADRAALGPLLRDLLGSSVGPGDPALPLDAASASALMELGNMLCGHYLNALSELAGLRLLPSPPALAVDMAGAVAQSFAADLAVGGDQALLVENRLLDRGRDVSLYLLYAPGDGGLDALLAGLARSTGVDPRG